MNKYPLDEHGIQNIIRDFVQHDLAQRELIDRLAGFLIQSLPYVDEDDSELKEDAQKLLKELYSRKLDFSNFRFDQQNGHKTEAISPYAGDPGKNIDIVTETQLNQVEEGFGEPMSEAELAAHFGESLPKKKKSKSINKMSLEEIQEWEKKQDNSNDIYKVSARVKNLARSGNANLTPVGDMLCNTFTHVLKAYYDFAESLQDKEVKIKLIELTRKQEEMPGHFIAATQAGVKTKG